MAEAPEKVYFWFLPKAEVVKCIENFKKVLAEGTKEEDKKKFEIKIKGTTGEPKGISFEKYSIRKDNYNNFVDASKDYKKKKIPWRMKTRMGSPNLNLIIIHGQIMMAYQEVI